MHYFKSLMWFSVKLNSKIKYKEEEEVFFFAFFYNSYTKAISFYKADF